MITKEMIQNTLDHWQPYSKDKLTEEDAREIIQNTVDLFDLLEKLDREQKSSHFCS
jgi:ABC-type enterochelin transport system ATPase subunit